VSDTISTVGDTAFASVSSPVPTDEEAAAISAAIEVLWPRAAPHEAPATPRSTAWRFSSRSWSRPLPVRRLRPWR
jgi:hypothetical protein